jgi:hypothetical protein
MLVRSYRFYASIIDARLASGYLTSRPGIYAAPRSLSVGQKLSRLELIAALRRAGALRVDTTIDLFVAAETLANASFVGGERLTILVPAMWGAYLEERLEESIGAT